MNAICEQHNEELRNLCLETLLSKFTDELSKMDRIRQLFTNQKKIINLLLPKYPNE